MVWNGTGSERTSRVTSRATTSKERNLNTAHRQYNPETKGLKDGVKVVS